jgi:N-acetylmuramoyl-L-alanine amidase
MSVRVAVPALALSLVLAGCAAGRPPEAVSSAPSSSGTPSVTATVTPGPGQPDHHARRPLAGRVVVLDPGHQLGNRHFPSQVDRQVPAGGFTKPCNTTGTSTDAGYPEATLTWKVSQIVKRRLEGLGARVLLTRRTNSDRRWGPCVDARGRWGNDIDADLKLSIHADGSYAADAQGFHVIRPPDRAPWTDDIVRPSRRLALDVRRSLRRGGFPDSTYRGRHGLDVRSDLGTLNLSDVPTVMVELGNMRDSRDASVMTRRDGRTRYAEALVAGVRAFLR